MRVLAITKPRFTATYIILGFGVLILLFGMLGIRSGAGKISLVLLSVGIFLVAVSIMALAKITSEVSMVSEVLSSLSLEEDRIKLSFDAKIEYGVLLLARYRMFEEGRGEVRTIRRFKKAGEAVVSELPLVDAEFQLIVDENGEGFISVPAVKVDDIGVWFLFLTDQGKVDASLTLVVSRESDYVQIALKGSGRRIDGEIRGVLEKAREARVVIRSREFESKRLTLMSVKGSARINKRFSFDVLPNEKLLLVIPDVYTTFPEVIRLLNEALTPPIIMGHGDFVVTLKLNVPYERDVVDEGIFTVMSGSTEKWGSPWNVIH